LEEYRDDEDEIPGIFSLMLPKSGALETFKKVSKYYDTYILSTAPWKNPSAWSDKLLWVQKYLGDEAHKRLILSHNKHLNVGDYLIDDRDANGADRFTGQHLPFSQADCPNLETVEAYLHLSLIELIEQYSFDELRIAREAWLMLDPIEVIEENNPVY